MEKWMMPKNSRQMIVLLFPALITQLELQRVNYDFLIKQGFIVEIFDLSKLVRGSAVHQSEPSGEVKLDCICKIESYDALNENIQRVASKAVFFDFIRAFQDIIWNTEQLYRMLKKHNAKYYIIDIAPLPMEGWAATSKGFNAGKTVKNLKKALNLFCLLQFAIRQLIIILTRREILYPKPDKVFCVNSSVMKNYIGRRNIGSENAIPIHSYDYDVYLHYLASTDGQGLKMDNTCVFLDQSCVGHPDMAMVQGMRLPSAEEYIASLNRLFDKIENETDLRVVIAGHPRAQYEKTPGIFGNREIIMGKSVELVAKSSMVVTHYTAAVNFAVLFDKPMVLVKTAGMVGLAHYNIINSMGGALGIEVINIDDEIAFEKFSLNYQMWSRSKYEDYKYKFVMSPDAKNEPIWKIVIDEIRNSGST